MKRIFLRMILGVCIPLGLAQFISVPLSAQIKTDHDAIIAQPAGTGRLLPFGSGRTTTRQAKALLKQEGITYIAHFGCRGAGCIAGAVQDIRPLNAPSQTTIFELTGFHPDKGAMTVVLVDEPCGSELKAGDLVAANIKTPRCFAGFRLWWRVFHDYSYIVTPDGWIQGYDQRIQAPVHPGARGKFGTRLWQDLGTVEIRHEAEGSISSGISEIDVLRYVLPDGTVASELIQRGFKVADSGGGTGSDPALPNLTRTGTQKRSASSVAISAQTEKSQLCLAEADAKADIKGQFHDGIGEIAILLTELFTLGVESITPTTGALPGGSFTMNKPDFATGLRNNADSATKGDRGRAYLDCMAREDPEADVPSPPSIQLILEDGAEERAIKMVSSFDLVGGKESCKSWTTQASEQVGNLICTITVEMSCDADCNCTQTESTVCTDF